MAAGTTWVLSAGYSDHFGHKENEQYNRWAIDFKTTSGSSNVIVAPVGGNASVVRAAFSKCPYPDKRTSVGIEVRIDAGNGWTYVLAHLSEASISDGRVEQGAVIGKMGSSGCASGVHLHFALWHRDGSQSWSYPFGSLSQYTDGDFVSGARLTRQSESSCNSRPLRVVDAFNPAPATALVGQQVSVTFQVRNINKSPCAPFVASLIGSGGRGPGGDNDVQDLGFIANKTIGPQQTISVTVGRSWANAGTFNVWPAAKDTYGNWFSIPAESNGQVPARSINVTSCEGAKPIVTSFKIEPPNPVVGQKVTSTFVVRNDGCQDFVANNLLTGVGGPNGYPDFPYVPNVVVPPKTEKTYTQTRTFEAPGTYTITPGWKNGANAWFAFPVASGVKSPIKVTLACAAAPVVVSDIAVWPTYPLVGQEVKVSFSVKNTGCAEFKPDVIGVAARGPVGENVDVEWRPGVTIAPGATYVFETHATYDTVGLHVFYPDWRNSNGNWNGGIPSADGATHPASISVTKPGECTSAVGEFCAWYYPNAGLDGNPAVTRTEPAPLDRDWAQGSPADGVPSDLFSGRWAGEFTFPAGATTFSVRADDGVRMWVDGRLLLDEWQLSPSNTYTFATDLTAGNHQVVVEYYENGGGASLKVDWVTAQSATPEPEATTPAVDETVSAPVATETPVFEVTPVPTTPAAGSEPATGEETVTVTVPSDTEPVESATAVATEAETLSPEATTPATGEESDVTPPALPILGLNQVIAVTGQSVQLRSEPDGAANVIAEIPVGASVTVLYGPYDGAEGWYVVISGRSVGWVSSASFANGAEPAADESPATGNPGSPAAGSAEGSPSPAGSPAAGSPAAGSANAGTSASGTAAGGSSGSKPATPGAAGSAVGGSSSTKPASPTATKPAAAGGSSSTKPTSPTPTKPAASGGSSSSGDAARTATSVAGSGSSSTGGGSAPTATRTRTPAPPSPTAVADSSQPTAAPSATPTAVLSDGQGVRASTALLLRREPGVGLVSIAPRNATGAIVDGPVTSDGMTWYQVDFGDWGIGWVPQQYLDGSAAAAAAGASSPTGTPTPSMTASATPTPVPPTATSTLTATPVPPTATPTSTETFVPTPTLTPTATMTETLIPTPTITPLPLPTETPTPVLQAAFAATSGFAAGQAVIAIADANMYQAPDPASLLFSVIPMGLGGAVVAGPVDATGITWYQIDAGVYGVGWVDASLLQASGPVDSTSESVPVTGEQAAPAESDALPPTEGTTPEDEGIADTGIVSIQPVEQPVAVPTETPILGQPPIAPTEALPVDLPPTEEPAVAPIEGIQPVDGSEPVETGDTNPEPLPTEDPFAQPALESVPVEQPALEEQPVDSGETIEQPPVEPSPTPGPLESVKIGLSAGGPEQAALVDGDPMTAWYLPDTVGIAEGNFTVDLGAVQHIGWVKWQAAPEGFWGNLYLQVSVDGVTWDEMPLDFSEQEGPWTVFKFDREVQYVRFVFRNDDAASLPQLGGLAEIEIWP